MRYPHFQTLWLLWRVWRRWIWGITNWQKCLRSSTKSHRSRLFGWGITELLLWMNRLATCTSEFEMQVRPTGVWFQIKNAGCAREQDQRTAIGHREAVFPGGLPRLVQPSDACPRRDRRVSLPDAVGPPAQRSVRVTVLHRTVDELGADRYTVQQDPMHSEWTGELSAVGGVHCGEQPFADVAGEWWTEKTVFYKQKKPEEEVTSEALLSSIHLLSLPAQPAHNASQNPHSQPIPQRTVRFPSRRPSTIRLHRHYQHGTQSDFQDPHRNFLEGDAADKVEFEGERTSFTAFGYVFFCVQLNIH